MIIKRKNIKNPSIVFICIGMIFFFIGAYLTYDTVSFKKNAESTTGYLVDYIEHYSDNKLMWSGIYEFNVDSDVYTTEAESSVSPKSLLKEEVTVYYKEENPNINKISADTFGPILFMIFGGAFSGIGICVAAKLKKLSKI